MPARTCRTQASRCFLLALMVTGCAPRATLVSAPEPAVPESSGVVTGALLDEEDEGAVIDSGDRLEAASPLPPPTTPFGIRSIGARTSIPSSTPTEAAYVLDGVPRLLRIGTTQSPCATTGLTPYFGRQIRFNGAAVVNPAFRDHLERFEEVVREVALGAYGRVPVRILHRGAFACRSRRGQPLWLSEHALGNALDVSGFDFGPSDDSSSLTRGVTQAAFRVSVRRDWQGKGDALGSRHSRFLRSLIARLVARSDVFRGIITPVDRLHGDHFHFDMGPRSYLKL